MLWTQCCQNWMACPSREPLVYAKCGRQRGRRIACGRQHMSQMCSLHSSATPSPSCQRFCKVHMGWNCCNHCVHIAQGSAVAATSLQDHVSAHACSSIPSVHLRQLPKQLILSKCDSLIPDSCAAAVDGWPGLYAWHHRTALRPKRGIWVDTGQGGSHLPVSVSDTSKVTVGSTQSPGSHAGQLVSGRVIRMLANLDTQKTCLPPGFSHL